MGKRKGKIQEIFSKAIHSDNPYLYIISYRDLNKIISVTLPEFLELSENLELIPVTRIQQIRKENEILYQKLSFGK
ncbi:MAG: DUF504 domain-containing protein [Nitrososphaeraceae archaeon]|nr:DUF504 domain-containing protein [Nitrososphaeraceae archaeon]